jgi:hypothetical protein
MNQSVLRIGSWAGSISRSRCFNGTCFPAFRSWSKTAGSPHVCVSYSTYRRGWAAGSVVPRNWYGYYLVFHSRSGCGLRLNIGSISGIKERCGV